MDDSRPFSGFGPNGFDDGRYMSHLARRSERLSRSMRSFCSGHNLTALETLTYLALGSLNIHPLENGLAMFVPVPLKRLAGAAGEQRQVRETCQSLLKRGYIEYGERPCPGWVVSSVSAWRELAEGAL